MGPMKQIYKTVDGKEFDDRQQAVEHEERLYRRWLRSDDCQPQKLLTEAPLDNPFIDGYLRETFAAVWAVKIEV